MKNKKRFLHLLLTVGLGVSSGYAQESSNTSGGDASGSGGNVAYSIGQTVYTYTSGSNGNTNQGVQQPYEIYTVGINKEPSNISLKTFPNPTTDFLTLQFDDYSNEQFEFRLFDLQGSLVQNGQIIDTQTRIDLSALSKGTYLISIIKESKEIKTFKIIKN